MLVKQNTYITKGLDIFSHSDAEVLHFISATIPTAAAGNLNLYLGVSPYLSTHFSILFGN